MTTGLYAALAALLIVALSRKVIKLRRQYKVALGDGGQPALQAAIRAQANATEYLPIGLILMLLLEISVTSLWVIHVMGVSLIFGRLLHAHGLNTANFRYRVLGMRFTFWTLIILAIANIASFANRLF